MGIVAMKTQAGGYKKEKMGNLSPHQAALKYVVRDTNVALAVPGVTTIDQIEECAAVMGTTLSQGDLNHLRRYQAFLKGRSCTMCGGCEGECPYGVPYGDVLRAIMYQDGYEDDRLSGEALREALALQNIEACLGCESCSVICRRGLDIQAQIRQVRQRFT